MKGHICCSERTSGLKPLLLIGEPTRLHRQRATHPAAMRANGPALGLRHDHAPPACTPADPTAMLPTVAAA